MSLQIGQQLGPYEITALLGEGGMGVVFRALDTKLGRDVALKLLPDHLADDSERLTRFRREAQVLATLNHPNIAQIHGLDDSTNQLCIVMELVDGETLHQRLRRGPIPIDEALQIAKQICEALEAAHEKGIIHRDLKPANIKLTQDGAVKVLDFGLARMRETDGAATNLSKSPTLMSASMPGMIMGTAAYMSPEQAKGRAVDGRTDVFAFGAVLYEMLTGRMAFDGEDVSDILSRVLQREPDWTLIPANVPTRIRELLRLCLEKNAKNRRQSIGDVRIDIMQALATAGAVDAAAILPARNARPAWVVAAAIVIAAMFSVPAMRYLRETSAPAPLEMRLEISTPATADPASIAISPDAQKIVFVASSEGRSKLWVRRLDSVSDRALVGTDDAALPFWSPDSQYVGFFAGERLKRVDVDRGVVQDLADAPAARGGAWNGDGTIIFSPNFQSPLFRISAAGGAVSPLTQIDNAKDTSHRFPYFLPDGHHFLYYVQGAPASHGIYVGDLNGSGGRRLLDVDSAPVYESSGHLFFLRQNTLFAQEFDAARLELKGSPYSVVEHIATHINAQGYSAVSASFSGPIVYRRTLARGRRQLLWLDRSGKEIAKAGDPLEANQLSVSPDGRHAALFQFVNNNSDVWLLDLGRNVLSRFTSDPAVESNPIWSSDGRKIIFNSNRNGSYDLYTKSVTGAGTEELLFAGGHDTRPEDVSPDGRFLLYADLDPKTGYKVLALPMSGPNASPTRRTPQTDGDRKPFPVLHTNFSEDNAQFSPNGKWIAYESNESGRSEIYVQPFPGPGDRTRVSTNGGAQVRWRRDGKELFYIALDDRLMAVPVQLASSAPTFEAGSPVPLFATRVGGALSYPNEQQYDVSPDGLRFLMNTIIEEVPSPITVILNWKPKP
jgi:Tol biopolymer transport system component